MSYNPKVIPGMLIQNLKNREKSRVIGIRVRNISILESEDTMFIENDNFFNLFKQVKDGIIKIAHFRKDIIDEIWTSEIYGAK